MMVTESDLPILISTPKLSHSWSSYSLSPSCYGDSERATGGSLAASHGHPTTLRYQTSHMDKYWIMCRELGTTAPMETSVKGMAPGARWSPDSDRAMPPPLLNRRAASIFFVRECLLGSAKFLPTHLTSILGQKMQYSKASLKNCWALLWGSYDSIYCQ